MTVYYKNNDLMIEDINLNKIAGKFPTPFYLYSSNSIIDTFNTLKKAINTNIYYSIKANSNQSIINLLYNLGAGMDVVSGGELQRALKLKVNPKKIIFEGVAKKKEDVVLAISKNIKRINVESLSELLMIDSVAKSLNKKINIGVRINPNIDAKSHKKISTGKEEDKFGISYVDIKEIIKKIKSLRNIKFTGISCHVGSQIFSTDVFEKTFKRIIKFIEIFEKNNLVIEEVNLGGGLGCDPLNKKIFNLNNFNRLVKKYFSNKKYEISFEPGRYLVAKSGIILTKIIAIKNVGKNNFLIVDAGMNTFLRPALYGAIHSIVPIKKSKKIESFSVAGPICESSDMFARNILLSNQKIGDYLAIKDTGAYGSSMSSNYNTTNLPAEIMVKHKNYELIRPAQKIEDIIKNDIIPTWIKNKN